MQGDHSGSSSLLMTTSGALNTRQTYYPYGAKRPYDGNALPTQMDYTFTGQKSDDSTGLMYYGARYYDTTLGRFTQADTIIPNPFDPQSFNRYAYTLNNPVRYTDPTGHMEEDPGGRGNGDPTPPTPTPTPTPTNTPTPTPTNTPTPTPTPTNTPSSQQPDKSSGGCPPPYYCTNTPTPYPSATPDGPRYAQGKQTLPGEPFWDWLMRGYRVTGNIWGAELSGTAPANKLPTSPYGSGIPNSGKAGLDLTVDFENGTSLSGTAALGTAAGAGGSVDVHGGILLNTDKGAISDPTEWSISFPVPRLMGIGIAISNQVSGPNFPLAHDVPQSITIGPAFSPGVQLGVYRPIIPLFEIR